MVVSTKGRYSLRLMLNIALHPPDRPVSLREIAEEEDISVKYLEQLACALSKAGLIRAERGACGGYLLTKEPKACSVLDILRAVERDMSPAKCVHSDAQCQRVRQCAAQDVWKDLAKAMDDVLRRWTLADLVARYHARCGPAPLFLPKNHSNKL